MSTCPKCRLRVVTDAVAVKNSMWHPHCFKCLNCQKKLVGKPYHLKKDVAFCTKCYTKMYRQRCVNCCDPIKGVALKAMGVYWHPGCFRCTICKCTLPHNYYLSKKHQQNCTICHQSEKMMPKRMGFVMPKLYNEIEFHLLEPDLMQPIDPTIGANMAKNASPSKFANLSNKFMNITFPFKHQNRASSPSSNESTKVAENVNILELKCPSSSSFVGKNFKLEDVMTIQDTTLNSNKGTQISDNLIAEKLP